MGAGITFSIVTAGSGRRDSSLMITILDNTAALHFRGDQLQQQPGAPVPGPGSGGQARKHMAVEDK